MTHPAQAQSAHLSAQRLMVDIEHLLPSPDLPSPTTAVDTATLSSLLSQLNTQVMAAPTQHTASALCTFLSTLRHRLPLIQPTPNCDHAAATLFHHLAHLFHALSTSPSTPSSTPTPAWSQTAAHLLATLSDLLSLTPAPPTASTLATITRALVPLLDPNDDDRVSDTSRASLGLLLVQLTGLDTCKRVLCAQRAVLMSALEHATDALVQEVLLEVLWRVLPRDPKGKRAMLKDLIVRDPAWVAWLVETRSRDLYPRMRARIVEANRGKSATRAGEYPMTVGVRGVRVSQDGGEYAIEHQQAAGVYVDCGKERITCTGTWVGEGLGGAAEEDEEATDRVLSIPYWTITSVDQDGLELHICASHAPSLTDPTYLATAHLVHVHFSSAQDTHRVLAAIQAHAPVSTHYSTSRTLPRQSSALVPLAVTPAPNAKTPEIRARAATFLQPGAPAAAAVAEGRVESQPMDVDMDDALDASYDDDNGMYEAHGLTRTIDFEVQPPTTQARGHVHVHVHQESTATRRPTAPPPAAVDRLQIQDLGPSSTTRTGTSSPARPSLVTEPGDNADDIDDMVGVTRRGRTARGRQVVVSQPDAPGAAPAPAPEADENQAPPTRTSRKRGSSPVAPAPDASHKRARTSKDSQPAPGPGPAITKTRKRTARASAKPPTTTTPGGIVDFSIAAPAAPARVPTSDTIGDEEGSVTPYDGEEEEEEDLGDGMAGFVPPEIPSGSEYIPTQPEPDVGRNRPATRGTTASELTDLSSSSRPVSAEGAGKGPETPARAVVARVTRAKAKGQLQTPAPAVAEGRTRRKAAATAGSSARGSSPTNAPASGSHGGSQGRGRRTTRNSTDSAAALDALATAAIAGAASMARTQTRKRPAVPAIQQEDEDEVEDTDPIPISSPAPGRQSMRPAPSKRPRHLSTPPPVVPQPSRMQTRPPTPPPLDLADMDQGETFEPAMPAAAKRRSPITGRTPSSPALPAPATTSAAAGAGLPAVVEDVDEDTRHTSDTMSAIQLPSPVTRPVAAGASHVLTTTAAPPPPPAAPAPVDDDFKGLMMQLMRSMNEHTNQMRAMTVAAPGSDTGRDELRGSSMVAAGGRSSSRSGGIVPGSDEEVGGRLQAPATPAPEVRMPMQPPAPPAPAMFRMPVKPAAQQQRAPVPSTPWPKFGSADMPTTGNNFTSGGLSTPSHSTRTLLGASGLPTPRSMLDTPRHHQPGMYTPQSGAPRPPMFATPYTASDRAFARAPPPPPAAPAPDLPPAVTDAILSAYHAMAQATIAHLSAVCSNNWARVEDVMRELESEVAGSVRAWVEKVGGGMDQGVQGLKEGEAARVEREREVVERIRGAGRR